MTLGILAAGGLTLGLVDPRAAVLAATAGGLFGVLVTLLPTNGRAGATVGIRETRAVVVAGALAIAATAWFGRDLSQLAAQPVVFGLAYLAFAVAVAMRFGAIPFHLWAARLTDVVPETALPILTALAPAAFAIVALAWTDASVAPLLVDLWRGPADRAVDRDRVDRPGRRRRVRAGRPRARRSATRSSATPASSCWPWPPSTRPPGRRPGRGSSPSSWPAARSRPGRPGSGPASSRGGSPTFAAGPVARRSSRSRSSASPSRPSAGPGLASFDARAALVGLALDEPLATFVLVATLAPLAYYGRLLAIGLMAPDRAGEPMDAWRPRVTRPDPRAIPAWLGHTWNANRAFTTVTIAILLAVLALATSSGAFGGPVAAAGLPPSLSGPGELVAPVPSGDLPVPVESVEP